MNAIISLSLVPSKVEQGGLATRITKIVDDSNGNNNTMLQKFRDLYADDPVLRDYNLWPATRDWLRAELAKAGKTVIVPN